MLTIPDVKAEYKITYPTAKADIMKLVSLGILAELENTHPTTYYAPAISQAAYGED
jgi:Fic family protein